MGLGSGGEERGDKGQLGCKGTKGSSGGVVRGGFDMGCRGESDVGGRDGWSGRNGGSGGWGC